VHNISGMFPLLVSLYFKFYFQKNIKNVSILKVIFHILQYTYYKCSLHLRNRIKTDYNQYNRSHTVIIVLEFIS